jgi:LmbE family N-acetylglucosaminyl deacetylase
MEPPLPFTELMLYSRANVLSPSKLMIVAHPDDESLFGGEALASSSGWTVVCVTSAGNPVRRAEFMAAMTAAKANWIMLDHADHLTNGRFAPRLAEQIAAILRDGAYELVVTHNARGEYGHPQHRALHRCVAALAPPGLELWVFGHHWRPFAVMSTAKRSLLAHYPSQRRSMRRVWWYASREKLRRVR